MRKRHVLVIDNDAAILRLISMSLKANDFQVTCADDSAEALKLLEREAFDLVILDIMVPGLGGVDSCQHIRGLASGPVIVVSDHIEEHFKVKCLELGADDFITKPFNVDELMARVKSTLRRASDAALPVQTHLSYGHINIDLNGRRVKVDGVEVSLTPTEFTVLQELAANTNKVVTHRTLLRKVWGREYADEREYLRVFINRLRRKIRDERDGAGHIVTVRGIGYSFSPACNASPTTGL